MPRQNARSYIFFALCINTGRRNFLQASRSASKQAGLWVVKPVLVKKWGLIDRDILTTISSYPSKFRSTASGRNGVSKFWDSAASSCTKISWWWFQTQFVFPGAQNLLPAPRLAPSVITYRTTPRVLPIRAGYKKNLPKNICLIRDIHIYDSPCIPVHWIVRHVYEMRVKPQWNCCKARKNYGQHECSYKRWQL